MEYHLNLLISGVDSLRMPVMGDCLGCRLVLADWNFATLGDQSRD